MVVEAGDEAVKAMFRLAQETARMAGGLLMKHFGPRQEVDHKGEIDLVTEVDRRSERAIVKAIRSVYPGDLILTEEGTSQGGDGRLRWIVDPLDGTTNYAHGYPCFCVSIAVERKSEIVLGVIYNPILDEMFAARKGHGATLNGEKLAISQTDRLTDSLLATGFPYDIRRSQVNNLDHFANFALRARAIRRAGSAALDLCYVAAGRFDGFWEMKLAPWDVAAGGLMVMEAGGMVTDFMGAEFRIDAGEILASNGKIHSHMIQVLRPRGQRLTSRR
jgi:myo-inositol-1(or 4)-monophosphatase